MVVPDFQTLMLPLLRFSADKAEHSLREAIDALAVEFGLSEDERKILLPSGQQPVFENRVRWARTYLGKAGLLEAPRRGRFKISSAGLDVLARKPNKIGITFLDQFPLFREFRTSRRESKEELFTCSSVEIESTPEESIETAFAQIKDALKSELLAKVKSCSPSFFERLVVDLLLKMGYGGSRSDAGRAVGRSGDGGIDGIINEDRLGLDVIYIQAKRWEGIVGRPEIHRFVGALMGRPARKGVFITTSSFTKEARGYAASVEGKVVVLIDGEQLAALMMDYHVGVTPLAVYELKRIDSDYFAED